MVDGAEDMNDARVVGSWLLTSTLDTAVIVVRAACSIACTFVEDISSELVAVRKCSSPKVEDDTLSISPSKVDDSTSSSVFVYGEVICTVWLPFSGVEVVSKA